MPSPALFAPNLLNKTPLYLSCACILDVEMPGSSEPPPRRKQSHPAGTSLDSRVLGLQSSKMW